MKIIQCAGWPRHTPCAVENQFLKSYDPEAFDGQGDATWTKDRQQAMQFDDAAQALMVYRQQSKRRPIREDGRPNRPLMTFSITIMDL